MKTLWFLHYSNIWELIAGLSLTFIIFLAYIPCLIALYYIIKNKMWLAIIPSIFVLMWPFLGNLLGLLVILKQECGELKEEYYDFPFWARCIILIPFNLLIISLIMLL